MTKKTLLYNDAVKIAAPPGFSAMIKPVGAQCNLQCSYCYYLDKKNLIDKNQKVSREIKNSLGNTLASVPGRVRNGFAIMDFGLLEQVVKQYIADTSSVEVMFVWHGGEPLLAGIDFYKRAIYLQQKYAGDKIVKNSLQTNGTLITREWAEFFAANDFLIGISIDGPEDVHNHYRVFGNKIVENNVSKSGSFDKVIRGLNLLKANNVEFNTLTVLTNYSEGKAVEIYNFLKSTGTSFMQFLPAVDFVSSPGLQNNSSIALQMPADWNISPKGYGEFMTSLFFEWLSKDVGKIFIQHFEVILGIYYGLPTTLCSYAETCGDALIVEHNGDVYSCDHFVMPENKLGNIAEKSLSKMASSLQQRDFGFSKRESLPDECFSCEFYFTCRGGCPKHRMFVPSEKFVLNNVEKSIYHLCEGHKFFLSQVESYMKKMAEMLRNGESLSQFFNTGV